MALFPTIQTEKTGLLDVDKLDNCYKFGYELACSKIDEIKERLNIEIHCKNKTFRGRWAQYGKYFLHLHG